MWKKQSCSSVLDCELRPGVTPSAQYKHAVAVQAQKEQELIDSIKQQCKTHAAEADNPMRVPITL